MVALWELMAKTRVAQQRGDFGVACSDPLSRSTATERPGTAQPCVRLIGIRAELRIRGVVFGQQSSLLRVIVHLHARPRVLP